MKLAVIVDTKLLISGTDTTKGNQNILESVKNAFEQYDHQVQFLGADKNLLVSLSAEKYDFIFNMAGKAETGFKPAQFVGIFDIMEIPYTGCGVDAISLCKNRALFNPIMQANLIPMPNYQVLKIVSRKIPPIEKDLRFPVVIKVYQSGIRRPQTGDDIAMDEPQLMTKLANLVKNLKYSYCMIEEFVFGRKFYVPIIGNDITNDITAMPVAEAITSSTDNPQVIFESMLKTPELKLLEKNDSIAKRAAKFAQMAFLYTNCRDFAIATFLYDKLTGNLMLHEMNPVPFLFQGGVAHRIAELSGMPHGELLNRILLTAMKRNDMKYSGKYSALEKTH